MRKNLKLSILMFSSLFILACEKDVKTLKAPKIITSSVAPTNSAYPQIGAFLAFAEESVSPLSQTYTSQNLNPYGFNYRVYGIDKTGASHPLKNQNGDFFDNYGIGSTINVKSGLLISLIPINHLFDQGFTDDTLSGHKVVFTNDGINTIEVGTNISIYEQVSSKAEYEIPDLNNIEYYCASNGTGLYKILQWNDSSKSLSHVFTDKRLNGCRIDYSNGKHIGVFGYVNPETQVNTQTIENLTTDSSNNPATTNIYSYVSNGFSSISIGNIVALNNSIYHTQYEYMMMMPSVNKIIKRSLEDGQETVLFSLINSLNGVYYSNLFSFAQGKAINGNYYWGMHQGVAIDPVIPFEVDGMDSPYSSNTAENFTVFELKADGTFSNILELSDAFSNHEMTLADNEIVIIKRRESGVANIQDGGWNSKYTLSVYGLDGQLKSSFLLLPGQYGEYMFVNGQSFLKIDKNENGSRLTEIYNLDGQTKSFVLTDLFKDLNLDYLHLSNYYGKVKYEYRFTNEENTRGGLLGDDGSLKDFNQTDVQLRNNNIR